MAVTGPFTWFEQAKVKIAQNVIRLDTHAFKAVLTTSAQALTAAFAGGSGGCRYADLTAELATANGYTSGGLALTGVSLNRTAGVVAWVLNPLSWTVTGAGLTFKWLAIYDDTAANKDLLTFFDFDTGGGSVNALVANNPLLITPSAGAGALGWS